MSNETSNGSAGQHAYNNEVFQNDAETTRAEDITITVSEKGITKEMKDRARQLRAEAKLSRTLSSNDSVNYDDIVSAEQLTKQVSTDSDVRIIKVENIGKGAHSNDRRMSTIARRRMSRVELDDQNDEFHRRELILKIRKTIPLKNFRDEIRARRDLEKFLVQPVVLLDITHSSLDLIIDALLAKLQKDLEVDEKIAAEAGKQFFTFQEQHQGSLAAVDQLRETIQGVTYKPEGANYEETWVTALCTLPMLKKSHVGIARLRHPLNLGNKSEEVQFVVAVIAPQKEKFTKNAVEIGRTFSSMMSIQSFRHELLEAATEDDFKGVLVKQNYRYKTQVRESLSEPPESYDDEFMDYSIKQFGRGIYDDIKRRMPHYWSDYKDGVVGKHTLHKLLSTTFFLYFACLLPGIAFGSLYEKNTGNLIGVTSCIVSQTFGGLIFALISGQPMLVVVTTAPLALYVKVIMIVSGEFSLNFSAMYTMTGIWNCIFMILQSVTNLSKVMKYSTRSIEEVFEVFIALAFTADAVKATILNFKKNYNFVSTALPEAVNNSFSSVTTVVSDPSNYSYPDNCVSKDLCYRPENSILFLALMLATLWLGLTLLRFDQSQFLSATKREILTDYALPIAVIAFSLVGALGFQSIDLEKFNYKPVGSVFIIPPVHLLPPLAHLGAMGLGLCLSCLFFVDQNLTAAVVNAPQNKLKKGAAYHWDMFVVALINIPLSVFNLPWVHASLPQSPLHVKALADVEQHVSSVGNVHDEIVKVRETRLTGIISHVLIGLSLLIVQYLRYIPIGVLQGLFLYLALSSFIGNQMFDRMLLFLTEGSSYPPNHYVRKVPQRKIHMFTLCQIVMLVVIAGFGFAEQYYFKMIFPIIILLLLPIRHIILPKIIETKYLNILDS